MIEISCFLVISLFPYSPIIYSYGPGPLSHPLFLTSLFRSGIFGVRSPRRRGLRLSELADLMVRHGATFAINMDGGSSSVMVAASVAAAGFDDADAKAAAGTGATRSFRRIERRREARLQYDNNNNNNRSSSSTAAGIRVISHPKCLKVPFLPCERPVATVMCVKKRRDAAGIAAAKD